MRQYQANSILSARHCRLHWRRFVSFMLALILFVSCLPFPVLSIESQELSQSGEDQQTPNGELIYDYETLKITQDGTETDSLELFEHEKIEIQAQGLNEDADYQWQVQHPENDDVWVNVYDGTDQTISVTLALVGNVLRADGTAKLRCRAYTGDYAYLTKPITVTLLSEGEAPAAAMYSLARSGNVSLLADDDPVPEFVTVTIEYELYVNQEVTENVFEEVYTGPAFTSYVATLKSETDLFTSVHCPTIVGYEPTLTKITIGGVEQSVTSGDFNATDDMVNISLTDITSDVIYTVEYRPAEVKYKVQYFFQNIYDDLYVEDASLHKTVTAEGKTGTNPSLDYVKASIEGFTSLYYEPETIAADGSTVFHVYYERNYYLMEFDCNEGYGTDTVYVRYGTYISVPAPVRSGYTFSGWDLVDTEQTFADPSDAPDLGVDADGDGRMDGNGTEDLLPSTMPPYNSAYKAIWIQGDTTFTVIYWVENANDDGYSYAASYENVAAKTGDVVTADNITGYSYVNDLGTNVPLTLTCPDSSLAQYVTLNTSKTLSVTIEGDGSSNFNIYFNRNRYTLKFCYTRSYVDGTTTKYQITSSTDGFNGNPSALSHWYGGFTEKPVLSTKYTEQTEDIGTYKYHYFLITAKIGQNLEQIWPDAPLDNAKDNSVYGKSFVSWGTSPDSAYYSDTAINKGNKNIKGPYSVMNAALLTDPSIIAPAVNHTMCAYWGGPSMYTYNIYFNALDDDPVDKTYLDVSYTSYASYTVGSTAGPGSQSALSFIGVKPVATEIQSNLVINFYYTRELHPLSFINYGETHMESQVSFGQSLASFVESAGTPAYPSTLEPGAYDFAGWYTGPNGTGDQITKETTMTMLDAGLSLFAYWKPVVRNVYFYYDYSDYLAGKYWYHQDADGNQVPTTYPIPVVHGSLLGTTYSNIPEAEDGYTFVGWFYIENGKKRFAPDTMEVKKNLHLFAEWQSGFDTEYTVTYVLGESTIINDITYPADTPVAAVTTGHLTAGKTKTFTAKVGTELYADFQSVSLFPEANSHSILMEQNKNLNNYEFRYVHDQEVWYKVRYVNKITGADLHAEKIEKSTQAIVTEKFEPIAGYIPESYYIRKVLASDGDTGSATNISELNEIVFYYTPDTTHGLYTIEYYTENLDGTWYLEQSAVGTGDLNDDITVTIDPAKFNGFQYAQTIITSYDKDGNSNVTTSTAGTVTGTVTLNGLEICIYYARQTYNYAIQFVEYGNPDNVLGYGKDGNSNILNANPGLSAKYESSILYTAPNAIVSADITYEFYATLEKPQKQTLVIRDSNSENVMVFYYKAKETKINYQAICHVAGATNFGVVSLNYESAATASNISGSNATAGVGFRFVGWYSDPDCTTAVNPSWRYTPGTATTPDVQNNSGTKLKPGSLNADLDEVTYYALFEPIYSGMTIQNNVQWKSDGTVYGSDNYFLFRIQGQGKNSYIDTVVSIQGNGSALLEFLPIGEYTVTLLTQWSWEYDDPRWVNTAGGQNYTEGFSATVTIIDSSSGHVAFVSDYSNVNTLDSNGVITEYASDPGWLSGEVSRENTFASVYQTT